jgi:hypothetical protein
VRVVALKWAWIGLTLIVATRFSYAGADDGHYQPAARAQQLLPALQLRGITVYYVDHLAELTSGSLDEVDCFLIYGICDASDLSTDDDPTRVGISC